MGGRTTSLAVVLGLGLLLGSAAAGYFGPGGYGDRSTGVVAVPTATDPATKAKIEERTKRLEEVQKEMQAPRPAGDRESYDAIMRRYQELQTEIVRLTLGPEEGAKYEEYQSRSREIQEEQKELWQDKTLDNETRTARSVELAQKYAALQREHGDVVRKGIAVATEVSMRSYRRKSLEALKPLLKASDDEWKVLLPKLEELVRVQGELRQLKATIWSGFYVNQIRWQNPPPTPEGAVIIAVKTDKPDVKAVKAKLDDLRAARTEAEAKKKKDIEAAEKKVRAAQDDVRGLLTIAQEAVLVVEGLLD